jgi:hypothetical protein
MKTEPEVFPPPIRSTLCIAPPFLHHLCRQLIHLIDRLPFLQFRGYPAHRRPDSPSLRRHTQWDLLARTSHLLRLRKVWALNRSHHLLPFMLYRYNSRSLAKILSKQAQIHPGMGRVVYMMRRVHCMLFTIWSKVLSMRSHSQSRRWMAGMCP